MCSYYSLHELEIKMYCIKSLQIQMYGRAGQDWHEVLASLTFKVKTDNNCVTFPMSIQYTLFLKTHLYLFTHFFELYTTPVAEKD